MHYIEIQTVPKRLHPARTFASYICMRAVLRKKDTTQNYYYVPETRLGMLLDALY